MSKREKDKNGFWLVRDNPISKVGVFPYMGFEISTWRQLGLEPNKLYKVYRPAETLQDPDAIASFANIPFIDDHTWLGEKGTPAEQKGVQGVTTGNVYFDAPYLKSDIKIFSSAAQKLIDGGKIELSPGYTCQYKIQPGNFEGEDYDLIAYNMRGNHLALVREGRTGPDVAMQDHLSFTIDSLEFINMEFTAEQLAQIQTMIAEAVAKALADAKATTDEAAAAAAAAAKKPDEKKPGATDEEVTPAVAEAVVETTTEAKAALEEAVEAMAEVEQAAEAVEKAVEAGNTTDSAKALKRHAAAMARYQKAIGGKSAPAKTSDSANETIKALQAQVDALTKTVEGQTVDAVSIAGQISRRDNLAKSLSEHVGTFDHAAMSLTDVAKYGLEKIGLKNVPAGQEVIAVDAWLHGRTPEQPAAAAPANLSSLSEVWAKQESTQGA